MAVLGNYAQASMEKPSSPLTDFTLLVDLSLMPDSWWSEVNSSDKTKGRASKGDGTELPTDWISFDTTTKTGFVRIKWTGILGAVNSADKLRIFPPQRFRESYATTDTYGAYNAYASHWWAYWPLEEDPSGTAPQMLDRTSNARHLTASPTMASNRSVAGKIGKAIDIIGSSDVLSVNDAISSFPATFLYWAQRTQNGDHMMLGVGSTISNEWCSVQSFGASGAGVFSVWLNTIAANFLQTGNIVNIGQWHHLTGIFEATGLKAFFDGSPVLSNSVADVWVASPNRTSVGSRLTTTTFVGSGIHDGPQLHTIVLSDDWIDYEYQQSNDQATFWEAFSWSGGVTTANVLLGNIDVPTIYDHDIDGGVDLKGEIKQVWGREALENALKMWITSDAGDVIRQPERSGYIMQFLTKPMSEVNEEDFLMSIRDGIDEDFTPALRIIDLRLTPVYEKRYWEFYLEVESVELRTRLTIEEKIKAQV